MISEKKDGTSKVKKNSTLKNQTILEGVTYVLGSVSRYGVEGVKKVVHPDTSEKIGKNLGVLRKEVENGWKNPKKLLRDDIKTTISSSSYGNIIGSTTRQGADVLLSAYRSALRYLGKGYKMGRAEILIAIWKIENLDATKTKKEDSVKQIRALFKL